MLNKLEILVCGLTVFITLYFLIGPLNEECSTIPRNGIYIVDKHNHRRYHENICQCSDTDDKFVNYVGYVMYEGLSSSDMYFLSCNKNILATMTVGNYFGIRIGDNNMFVRYLFRDRNYKVIGYSDDEYKSSDVIEIKDVHENQIATLKKIRSGIGWTITIINQNHTLSDSSILLKLVREKAFDNDISLCFLIQFVIWPYSIFVSCICGMIVCITYYWRHKFF